MEEIMTMEEAMVVEAMLDDEVFEDERAELVYIPIDCIHEHPDNPRKELGDLTELAESIKAKGIMQNLTVVPFVSKYKPGTKVNGEYTVVIGHRRLGASKLAGLTEVPCVISDMSYKEQLATMLAENMQRSDLGIYEEACGMQMLLDLGDTVESVSAQTGVSVTTVRRRVKLMEMDREKVKKSLDRGATLEDFEKLGKIKDEDTRNKLLDSIGTTNFDWDYRQAVERLKRESSKKDVVEALSRFASPIEDVKGLVYVNYYPYSAGAKVIEAPEDADRVKYRYYLMSGSAGLYRERNASDEEAEIRKAEENKKINELRDRFREIDKRAYECRRDFIRRAWVGDKEQLEAVIRFAAYSYVDGKSWQIVTDKQFCDVAGLGECGAEGTIDKVISGEFGMKAERALLLMAYCNVHDSDNESYADYYGCYQENEKLNAIYTLLGNLGYMCSDEEIAWINGDHELYVEDEE